MKMIFVVLYAGLAFATVENPDCDQTVRSADNSLIELAQKFTQTCPEISLIEPANKKPLSLPLSPLKPENNPNTTIVEPQTFGYIRLGKLEAKTPKQICDCLKDNKFSDIRVPDEQKKAFNEDNINESIGKNISFAMGDLFGNVTRFKNLNLPNDLHEKSKTMCSAGKLVKSIQELQAKANTPGCKASGEQFEKRLKNILGETKLEDYALERLKYNLGVDENTCISRQKFLHLRSSTYREDSISVRTAQASTLRDFFLNDNLGPNSPELLKFDFFFSQGMRDPEFKAEMAEHIKTNYTRTPLRGDLSRALPADQDAMTIAFKSLERGCTELSEQIQTFLCSEKVPMLHSRNLSLAINDKWTANGNDQATDQSVREFFVKRYACMEGEFASEETKKDNPFNKFYEASANLKRGLVDPVSENPDSDYSRFNKTFCKGREGTPIRSNDLGKLLNDFIADKRTSNIDITSVLGDPSYAGILNFNYDPNANPPITPRIRQNGSLVLPEISYASWEFVARDLVSKGMTRAETDQLYSIIEMQTNLRVAEIRSVRERLQATSMRMAFVSDVEVDGLLRNDPVAVENFKKNYPNVTDPVAMASTMYEQQEQNRTERFDTNGIISKMIGDFNMRNPQSAQGRVDNQMAARTEDAANSDKPQDKSGSTSDSKATKELQSNSTTKPSLASSTYSSGTSSSGSSSASASTSSGSGSQELSSGSSDASPDYESGTYSRSGSAVTSSRAKELNDDIKRMQDEVELSKKRFEDVSRSLASGSRAAPLQQQIPRSNGRSQGQRAQVADNYQYPKNLPVKNQNGEYYQPEAQGSELSSASGGSNSRGSSSSLGGSAGSGGVSASAGSASVGGGASFGSGGVAGKASGRNPASSGTDSGFLKNLAPYEHNKLIPHSIFDVVGSIDKVILLLGLEGKSFKTIEAIEEPDKTTGKINIKYYQRSFDFVAEGKFEKFKELFSTKDSRSDAFNQYFNFPRTKENLTLSKQYSLATKQISKEEVTHSYVLNLQNYILSDDEIQVTMNRTMELLK